MGKLGRTYVLSATVIHIGQANALCRANVTLKGEPDDLIPAMTNLVRRTLDAVTQAG